MTIQVKNISFRYHETAEWVFRDLSLSIEGKGLTLLLGQNGAGKSTLLRLLNGLLKPVRGSIQVAKRDTAVTTTSEISRHLVVTFQNPGDQLFAPTVEKELQYAPFQMERENISTLVTETAALFGLTPSLSRHPYDLPPAQRKMLAVASAVSSGSPMLAFDEPSAGLSQIERSVLTKAISILKHSRMLIIVSHDFHLFLPLSDRVIALGGASVAFDGTAQEFLSVSSLLRRHGLLLPPSFRMKRLLGLPLL
ncbi:MAG TPA: ABC transporter ATP-binding protein [Bacteroidota bacterium]|nr:ABC transporter ATP-binding protein [Bacteroidota bacterium]